MFPANFCHQPQYPSARCQEYIADVDTEVGVVEMSAQIHQSHPPAQEVSQTRYSPLASTCTRPAQSVIQVQRMQKKDETVRRMSPLVVHSWWLYPWNRHSAALRSLSEEPCISGVVIVSLCVAALWLAQLRRTVEK